MVLRDWYYDGRVRTGHGCGGPPPSDWRPRVQPRRRRCYSSHQLAWTTGANRRRKATAAAPRGAGTFSSGRDDTARRSRSSPQQNLSSMMRRRHKAGTSKTPRTRSGGGGLASRIVSAFCGHAHGDAAAAAVDLKQVGLTDLRTITLGRGVMATDTIQAGEEVLRCGRACLVLQVLQPALNVCPPALTFLAAFQPHCSSPSKTQRPRRASKR